MIKKILIWGVVVFVVLLAGAYFVRNYIVEQAVEEGSTRVFGLQTDLGSAGLSIQAGSLDLNSYRISNPDEYTAENIFSIEHGMLDVDRGSIFDDVVVVDSLVIQGVRIAIEQKDTRGNYSTLLDNIRQADFGSGSSSDETKLKIGRVALRDINVSVSLVALGETRYEESLTLENFTIDDIGGESGATVGEVAARVVRTTLQRAISEGQSRYPDIFSGKVEDAVDKAKEAIEDEVGKKLEDVGKSVLGGE